MLENQANLIVTDGGMGDLLGSLVAVDWMIQHNSKFTFHVWIPEYLVKFSKHVLPRKRCIVRSFKDEHLFRKEFPTRTTQWTEMAPTPMRMSALDYGFICLADRLPNAQERAYLQIRADEIDMRRFDLPKNYVCLAAAAAEPVKSMPPAVANAIIDYLSPKYPVVFLGKEEANCGYRNFAVRASRIPIALNKGIDLVNKTDLLESAAVLAGALAFVGMDGGLVHLAGCTPTKIVAGYTLVDPSHAAPTRGFWSLPITAVEPDPDIPNRYWQSTASCLDRRDCRVFPGWEKVLENLTADKFISALESIGI